MLQCISKTISSQTAWASNFHLMTLKILHFLVKHSWESSFTDYININKYSHKIVLMERVGVLMPTMLAISCRLTRWFCNTMFSKARHFSSQTASDGCPSGAQLQVCFCLNETWLPRAWLWHMMMHLHCKQQSFGYLPAVAKHSLVANIL